MGLLYVKKLLVVVLVFDANDGGSGGDDGDDEDKDCPIAA
jgi:hypothetical protein